MNLYIDTSALIKRHVEEAHTELVREWVDSAATVGTGALTRAEVSSGINRLHRMNLLDDPSYSLALNEFRKSWDTYHRIPISEQIVARADFLICQFVLRGYDAIHLACALVWQEALQMPVTLATFDSQLRDAAKNAGLFVLPE
jgi:predicted nucleic acid-binding protein